MEICFRICQAKKKKKKKKKKLKQNERYQDTELLLKQKQTSEWKMVLVG
jgi:hypothetical protein